VDCREKKNSSFSIGTKKEGDGYRLRVLVLGGKTNTIKGKGLPTLSEEEKERKE